MSNDPKKDEIAKRVQVQIRETVELWLATGEFDLHERVHGLIVQALSDYENGLRRGQGDPVDCPGQHGESCCSYPDLCREAMSRERNEEGVER